MYENIIWLIFIINLCLSIWSPLLPVNILNQLYFSSFYFDVSFSLLSLHFMFFKLCIRLTFYSKLLIHRMVTFIVNVSLFHVVDIFYLCSYLQHTFFFFATIRSFQFPFCDTSQFFLYNCPTFIKVTNNSIWKCQTILKVTKKEKKGAIQELEVVCRERDSLNIYSWW